MSRVSDIYAGDYLKAADLLPLGQRRTAIVHAAQAEPIGPEQKQAVVLDVVTASGKAWPKRIVLNKTNALLMATAFGDDYSQWPGRQLAIWSENVTFKGQVVAGIKVQPLPPTVAAAVAPRPAPAPAERSGASPAGSDGAGSGPI
jgi:hypothetical protein